MPRSGLTATAKRFVVFGVDVTVQSDPDSLAAASSPDVAAIDSVASLPPIPVPGAPRFCRTCGNSLESAESGCTHCNSAALRAVPLSIAEEHRALKSAIALYFTLLGVCAIGIAVGSSWNALDVQFGVTIGLSTVAIGWALVSWKTVLPILGRGAHVGWFGAAIGLSFVTFAIATAVISGFAHLMMTPHAPKMSDDFLRGIWMGDDYSLHLRAAGGD